MLQKCSFLFLLLLSVCCAKVETLKPIFSGSPREIPVLNIDKSLTTVSGLSAGGYMAVQMHVVYSSYVQGAAVFAGGPYNCAGGDLVTALGPCMRGSPPPDVGASIAVTKRRSESGQIDDATNLADDKVFVFVGSQDSTVAPPVGKALSDYYKAFIPEDGVLFNGELQAAHTQPTDDPRNRNACTTSASPYLSDCDYDGAGVGLAHMLGDLSPRNDAALTGEFVEWRQSDFVGKNRGMAETGWLYIPASCANGVMCKLHISFHGCLQSYSQVGDAYVKLAGYNQWADTNNIVVLYPQSQASQSNPQNPNGCFDWWGYNGQAAAYDTRDGIQLAAVDAAVDKLCSGFSPIDAPSGLVASDITDHSAVLSWDAVEGAHSYHLYLNSDRANDAPVTGLSYKFGQLSPGTRYSLTVVATTEFGSESPKADPVAITTHGDPPPARPPTGLRLGGRTPASLTVEWDAAGEVTYNVYRDGRVLNKSPLTDLFYEEDGLEADTLYTYTVTSLMGDFESVPSTPVSGKTAPLGFCPVNGTCKEFRDENYGHLSAGRASMCLDKVCAHGSGDELGTVLEVTTIRGYSGNTNCYDLGPCP